MSACSVCGACPCYEHTRETISPLTRARCEELGTLQPVRVPGHPRVMVWQQAAGRVKRTPSPCCIARARRRYWRLVRAYVAFGMVLGVAIGMVLGAAAKVCAP